MPETITARLQPSIPSNAIGDDSVLESLARGVDVSVDASSTSVGYTSGSSRGWPDGRVHLAAFRDRADGKVLVPLWVLAHLYNEVVRGEVDKDTLLKFVSTMSSTARQRQTGVVNVAHQVSLGLDGNYSERDGLVAVDNDNYGLIVPVSSNAFPFDKQKLSAFLKDWPDAAKALLLMNDAQLEQFAGKLPTYQVLNNKVGLGGFGERPIIQIAFGYLPGISGTFEVSTDGLNHFYAGARSVAYHPKR